MSMDQHQSSDWQRINVSVASGHRAVTGSVSNVSVASGHLDVIFPNNLTEGGNNSIRELISIHVMLTIDPFLFATKSS